MDYKRIETGGIIFFTPLGKGGWHWGMDYTGGDLYEAEELFKAEHRIRKNRLLFLHLPDGKTAEPVKAREGQYLGRPVLSGGRIYCLLVDFAAKKIRICRCRRDMEAAVKVVELPLEAVTNCYNLMLETEPLTLVRQGNEGRFDVVWPEKSSFEIDPRESFDSRDGDRLIFSQWFEDPDYREETVIRHYPDGAFLERLPGALFTSADGKRWLMC